MKARAAIVALAVAAAVVPVPAPVVERAYSTTLYAALQRTITPASNAVPIALFDVFVIGVLAAWLVLGVRDLTARTHVPRLRAFAGVLARTLTWAAVMYIVFLVTWGLNYRRVPLADKVAFDPNAVTPQAAARLADASVRQVNDLFAASRGANASATDRIDSSLAASFADAVRIAGPSHVAVARPKRSVFDWWFRRTAVSGMTDPFFLETLIASDVLPFEHPFVVAHEWSHLAGINDEGEANFIAWLTCVRGGAAHRYSGWLFVFQELMPSLPQADRAAIAARLADGPRADLRAVRERYLRNVSPRLSAAGWRAYDSYLKANRVESGAASYGEVTRLILGVRFGADWTPQLR